MKTWLARIWSTLAASFWFMPAVMAVAALLLAVILITFDKSVDLTQFRAVKLVTPEDPQGVMTLVSTMIAAVVTIVSIVFSITIVTLTLTSSQFGSRLLRTFTRDTGTQVSLGVFIATFVYGLAVLVTISVVDDAGGIPHLATLGAVIITLLNMAVLVYFIHHVSQMIQAPHVVSRVALDIERVIDQFFPNKIGDDGDAGEPPPFEKPQGDDITLAAPHSNYLQGIDFDTLKQLAVDHDLFIDLQTRPGRFLVKGEPVAVVTCTGELDDDTRHAITNCLLLGVQRTEIQDVKYAVHQLAEIAVRALSPGVNDPFTAINCIDRLGAAMAQLAQRRMPEEVLYDDDKPRVRIHFADFASILNAGYNMIRQNSRSSVAVMIRMLESLEQVAQQARSDAYRQAILRQARMIHRASLELPDVEDQQDVHRAYERLQASEQAR